MKTRAWVLAAMLTMAAVALAEDPPRRPASGPAPGERPGVQMLERIRFSLGELKLSDEQKSKVDAIFKKAREGLDAMREEMQAMEPQQRMARAGEYFKSVRDDIAAVLNEEQRAILDKKLDEARQGFRNRVGGGAGGSGRPTTGPAGPGGPDGPMRPGQMLERMRDAVLKLNLTPDQQQQVRALLEDVRSRGTAIREQAQAGENIREKGRELLEETKKKVNEILKPEQQEKLRELLNQSPAAPSTRAMMMEEDMMRPGERKPSARKSTPSAHVGDMTKAQVGTPAPQFALKKLDGSLVQLSSLKGRVVVLEFGSWTCPIFRDRAAAMEKLKNDYSTRAQFFVVYAKEAHAKDEWEVARNKDLDIVVEQPKTVDARVELAKKAREELKLTTPVIVDSMGNDTAIAYGAGPNSAVVINRDGMIVAHQQWFDPAGLRRAIDEAAKATPTTKPAL